MRCRSRVYLIVGTLLSNLCHVVVHTTHSRILHCFFSYLLTCELYLIKVYEIMAQMGQNIIISSLKPIKVTSNFILNYLKKSCRGCHHSEITKTNTKTMIFSLWMRPQGSQGCQKNRKNQRINTLVCFCANI